MKKESAAPWPLDNAVEDKPHIDWDSAFEKVHECTLPVNASVITPHIVCKLEKEEAGTLRLKARRYPHGYKARKYGMIRKDASTEQFEIIQLLLSMSVLFRFHAVASKWKVLTCIVNLS